MTSFEITPWDVLTSSNKYPEREQSDECTSTVRVNAADLAERVSRLLNKLGFATTVSSGFRTTQANKGATGAKKSAHLNGEAVDLSDPHAALAKLITVELLEEFDLYMEEPASTVGWVHLTTRPPNSRKRIFKP